MADTTEFLTLGERVEHAIATLPTLSREEIPLDDACPICLQSFETIHEGRAQEEVVANNGFPNGTDPEEHRGVTKLTGCGHVFCRFDLIEWIRGWHGTCPACRAQFANIRPPSYSEDGSSDGDYVPGEDDEDDEMDDEDDGFMDTDGFDAEADDYDFELGLSDDEEMNSDILQDFGLPPDYDLAADVDAVVGPYARRLREPGGMRGPPAIDMATDINVFINHHGRLARDGSEAEVLRDLDADAEGHVNAGEVVWDEADEEAMENWGLSHSDEDASESLSEGELFRSMEDISSRDDAAVVAEPDSTSIEIAEAETK